MKKLLHKSISFILVLTIVLSLFAGLSFSSSALSSSGSCGNNVRYTFTSSTGKLIISGSGEMTNGSPFRSQTSIKTVVVESGVTSIGQNAFYGCSGLTSITIPNSVTSIGGYAFYCCKKLSSITIPDSVTSISSFAFYGCSGLTSVTIGNSVTSIGYSAFYNCSGLTSITIPASVTSIGENAFGYCTGIASITVDGNNAVYDSREQCNAVIETATNTLIAGCKNTVIPNSVTSIGNYAFSGCRGLTSIKIPNSATSIGNDAFAYCRGLIEITIPASVTSIGEHAFYDCSSLKNVYYIGTQSQWNNLSVEIKNDALTDATKHFVSEENKCGENVYYDLDDSTGKLTIFGTGEMEDYQSYNGSPFYQNSAIKSVEIQNGVTSIGDCAFYDCSCLTSVTIPASVTSIGEHAFYDCGSLIDVYYIGTQSQWNNLSIGIQNDALTSATRHFVSEVNKCGENVYYDLDASTGKLTIFGNGEMEDYQSYNGSPFYQNSAIKSVEIQNGVTSIGGYAFYCCKKLSSITIPDSVTSISSFAFYGCSGLTSVTIGNSVTSIGSYAFADCICLTSVTIGNFVTYIANSAFENCSSLKSILIPDSVTHIDWDAFCDCIGLKELTMPCGLLVHREAFKKCTNIEKVTLTKGTGTMQGYGSNSYQYTPWYISRNSLKEIVLEDGIRNIGEEAFSDCSNLTSITIPDSVTRIDYKSFYGCSSLSSIDIRNDSCTIYDSGYTIPNNIIIIINGSKNVYNYAKKYKRNYICNHVEEIDVATGPTCTKSGLTQGSHCKACGTVIVEQEETEPAWGHDYIKTAGFAATCTTTGKEDTYTCSRCSESYGGETIAALGHSYNNAVITTNPTCTSKGRQKYNCSRCDYSYYEDVAELGHDYNKTAGFAATCTKTGKADIYTCSRCGVGYGGETIAPLGHNYNKTSTTYSTCTTRGNNTYICSRCFNSYTEQLPLAEHSYSLVNLIQKATPLKQGKITKSTCSVCGIEGETQTIFVPKAIVLSTNSVTYSGKQCKPAVTVKDSAGKVIDTSNYTVAYSNNTNAGTAKVTVTFKGDYYEGSMNNTFKISPKKLTNCYYDTVFTYSGKAIVPVPYYYKTEKVDTPHGIQEKKTKVNFQKGKEYTIAVSGKHKDVGKYTATIKFIGNYTGTVKKTFEIRPKPVTKSSAKPYSTTSVKIAWNKVAGVSGYSIYRFNQQNSKWVKYKNTTATSMVVPRVTAKDTDVTVRIWTYKKVGGKVYYNDSAKVHYESGYTKPGKPTVKLVNTDFGNFVIKFNRVAWHQTQLSDNKAFSNKGNNICVTYRKYGEKVTATGWGSVKKYYVRTREYYYDNNNKLIVGPWSDTKSITTY